MVFIGLLLLLIVAVMGYQYYCYFTSRCNQA